MKKIILLIIFLGLAVIVINNVVNLDEVTPGLYINQANGHTIKIYGEKQFALTMQATISNGESTELKGQGKYKEVILNKLEMSFYTRTGWQEQTWKYYQVRNMIVDVSGYVYILEGSK